MNRRSLLALLASAPIAARLSGGGAAAQAAQPSHPLAGPWAAYKAAHLDPSGRIVDRLQSEASHSEGQGYAMTIAALMGDEDAFRLMYRWTEDNLAIRDDALLAWRWLPDAADPVPDPNNATDGDLFYAWALNHAASAFAAPDLRERAAATVADIERLCIVDFPGQDGAFLMLPASFGFATETGFVINPSYYMLKAMTELGAAFGAGRLSTSATNGDVLLAEIARHGPMPDWIEVTEAGLLKSDAFSLNSGYEALRVPLWMVWSGHAAHPAVLSAARARAAVDLPDGHAATVLDYDTGAVLETSPSSGYRAIEALTLCAAMREEGSTMPAFDAAQPYYPATLQLFASLAQIETLPECFPI